MVDSMTILRLALQHHSPVVQEALEELGGKMELYRETIEQLKLVIDWASEMSKPQGKP